MTASRVLTPWAERCLIWASVQVVSLHCNLDADTKHLINAERLAMMKPDAVLVNAARGPVIDETALVAHLQANPEFRRARPGARTCARTWELGVHRRCCHGPHGCAFVKHWAFQGCGLESQRP